MADALKPWIVKYLLDIAEQYGTQLYKVPVEQKGKKVQLVQFLTCSSENQPSFVWATASDKSHKVPIRLNAEAVKEYQGNNGGRLTKAKTAIVSIKCYKPLFCRVPKTSHGLTKDACLALECNKFSVLGSFGEACFGDPMPVEDVEDLKLWADGLRQDGGAGNVLKNRQSALKEGADATGSSGAMKKRDLMESYKKKWKPYVNAGLAQPGEGDIAKFEKLRTRTLSSSPEQVIVDWETTPEKESGCLSWKEVQRIMMRTGRIRERERGKDNGV